jgi:glutamate/tyrosine decarboxylase-like PLP-dependent enzyme
MLHGEAIEDGTPGGLVTSGGSGSIAHAVLSYREQARRDRGLQRWNVVKPETAHPAFDKACHLFGIELRKAPIDPVSTRVDVDAVDGLVDDETIAVIGSACNYGYGTIDPIEELSELAVDRGIGLHVDGCLGGFVLPWGQELGYAIPTFDFRLPGVTTISADTHKYGYAFKGSSVVLFRDVALRNSQYFHLTDWTGGKYCSPSMDGSRSVGLLASTWAAMVKMGRDGYLRKAGEIFDTAERMKAAVGSHPELRIIGEPTFCFSFTSDEFDIYLVNDRMRERGWRFNGQQYPNAIHMAVTGPQTQPGVVEDFEADLATAVAWAKEHRDETAATGAIYGGVAGGMNDEADDFIRMVMDDMMDQQLSVPEP